MNFGRSADPFGFNSVDQDVGMGLQLGFAIDFDAANSATLQPANTTTTFQTDEEDLTSYAIKRSDTPYRVPENQPAGSAAGADDEFDFELNFADQKAQEKQQAQNVTNHHPEPLDLLAGLRGDDVDVDSPATNQIPEPTAATDQIPEPTAATDQIPEPTAATDQIPEPTAATDQIPEPTAEHSFQEPDAAAAVQQSEANIVVPKAQAAAEQPMPDSDPVDDWKDVPHVALRDAENEDDDSDEEVAVAAAAADSASSSPASVAECVAHFDAAGVLSQYRAGIQTCVELKGLAALRRLLCGPPSLRAALRDRRDLLFCLACCPFDNNNEIHLRMLATVYRGLLQEPRRPCPRFGAHWESVGFQGSDPSTDLRGCGMLGPLCLLHLVTQPRLASLRAAAFRLSLDPDQNYPFCVMSINLTRAALIALRHQSLNRLINASGDPLATFLDVYTALLQRLHTVWSTGAKNIMDSGFVVRDLEAACIKDPEALLRELSSSTEAVRNGTGQSSGRSSVPTSGAKVNSEKFVDLCAA